MGGWGWVWVWSNVCEDELYIECVRAGGCATCMEHKTTCHHHHFTHLRELVVLDKEAEEEEEEKLEQDKGDKGLVGLDGLLAARGLVASAALHVNACVKIKRAWMWVRTVGEL